MASTKDRETPITCPHDPHRWDTYSLPWGRQCKRDFVLSLDIESGMKHTAEQNCSNESHQDCLAGPIPMTWLEGAASLPGKSLQVALLLWYVEGVENTRTVALSNQLTARFSVDRNAKYRALEWLELADLISVNRGLGRSPLVTIKQLLRESDDS